MTLLKQLPESDNSLFPQIAGLQSSNLIESKFRPTQVVRKSYSKPIIHRVKNRGIFVPWETENIPSIAIIQNSDTAFKTVIEESKELTQLPNNWDDEGAQPVTLENWASLKEFLENYYSFIKEKVFKTLPAPIIDAVPDGSIDILWLKESRRMLVNISQNTAKYYGDLFENKNSIKGQVGTTEVQEFLAFWLSKFIAE